MTTENTDQNVNAEESNQQVSDNSDSKEDAMSEEKLMEQITNKQTQMREAVASGKTELPTEDIKPSDNSDSNAGDEEQGEPIDQTLVDAARSAGMSDEEIIDMATDNPKALETLASAVIKANDSTASNSEKDNKDDEKKVEQADDKNSNKDQEPDLSNLDPEVAKIVEPLLKEVKELRASLKKVDELSQENTNKKAEEIQAAINQDFDELTEAFPVIGTTETLSVAQFKLREQVLEEALAISALPSTAKSGMQWPDCLKKAATSLLGEPKTVKDNKQKDKSVNPGKVNQLFTHRPTGRKATSNKQKGKVESHEELIENIANLQNTARQGAGR